MDVSEIWGNLIEEQRGSIICLIMDGLGGLPHAKTGKTELQTANPSPNLDRFARVSSCGLLEIVGPGITTGSGPGHLALFHTREPWSSLVLFFLVIFLAYWAGGAWFAPFGPALWGISFLPFLLVGLIFALLLAAAVPSEKQESTVELVDREQRRKERAIATIALSVFFWILIGVFVVVIISRYIAA